MEPENITGMVRPTTSTVQIIKMALDVVKRGKMVALGNPEADLPKSPDDPQPEWTFALMTGGRQKGLWYVKAPTVPYPFFFETPEEAAEFFVKSWIKGRPIDMDAGVVRESEDSVFDKPQWVADFKAGWEAAKSARSEVPAKRAYARVSTKHGNFWIDGYTAWLDHSRGATTGPVKDAEKMGLVEAKGVPIFRFKSINLPQGGAFADEWERTSNWRDLQVYDLGDKWDIRWAGRGGQEREVVPKSDARYRRWLAPAFKRAGVEMPGGDPAKESVQEEVAVVARAAVSEAFKLDLSAWKDELKVDERIIETIMAQSKQFGQWLEKATGLEPWSMDVAVEGDSIVWEAPGKKARAEVFWIPTPGKKPVADVTVEVKVGAAMKEKTFRSNKLTRDSLSPDALFGWSESMFSALKEEILEWGAKIRHSPYEFNDEGGEDLDGPRSRMDVRKFAVGGQIQVLGTDAKMEKVGPNKWMGANGKAYRDADAQKWVEIYPSKQLVFVNFKPKSEK